MQSNIQHKRKSPYLLPLLMLLLTFLSISIPSLTVHAAATGGAAGNGDGQSTDNTNLGEHHNEGYPSWGKTGWLVYLTDTNGSLISDVAFVSAGSNLPAGYNDMYLTTRVGNAWVANDKWYVNAEWGAPFLDGGAARGYEIKQELITGTNYSGGLNSNVDYVILKYLGSSALSLFKSSPNYYLVLETCAWHRIFTGNYQDNYAVASASGWARLEQDSNMTPTGDPYTGWMDNGALQISAYLDKDWEGLPAVPTDLGVSVDNPSTYIPNSTLSSNLGYGMIAIRSVTEATHTWDSSNHPTDEAPAPEEVPTPSSSTPPSLTDYQYTIIKSYRLRDEAAGTLIDKGTYTRNNTVATITIENEPLNTTDKNYRVIGWKTSTSSNSGISSLDWENSVPNIVGTTGSSPATTTLTPTYKVLYVLLEAQVSTPSQSNCNYILHESSITRRINYSTPDFTNTNMTTRLNTYSFLFISPTHSPLTCPSHTWTHGDDDPACNNYREEGGECDCNEPWPNHADDCGIHDDPTKICNGHTYTCKDFIFSDSSLQFGLKNILSSNYPSILASNWSFEIPVGDPSPIEKNISLTRLTPYMVAYNKYFNAYGVIMRGDDILSLAEWKNSNAGLAANTVLPSASSVRFRVSNTIHGNRKTSPYTQTFNRYRYNLQINNLIV